jgi:membrane-bound lytic murein transglycosylase D
VKPPVPTSSTPAAEKASAEFALGRQAALSGDFDCAREHFRRALDAARPPGAAGAPDPALTAFSIDLYEGILRYEALAGPSEEAGSTDSHVAPELAGIEAPEASASAIEQAREAVASDQDQVIHDVPIVVNEAVLKVLATFQEDLHDIIARGLGRSGRYIPMIHRIFEEEGIPRDLAQVALIESSFIPHARSPMSAHGIWQFMPRTGRQYGLTANAVVDERRDPEKATRAAARYLSYLHELFHDWHLAMAAYNAGEGKILRAMARTGARDFWELAASGAIRPQTQNYVPAVIAAILIARNPSHYGFEVVYEPPLEYETVALGRPVRLSHLADGDALALDELRRLNPELKTLVTPRQPEGYQLKVPPGSGESVLLAFAGAPTAKLPSQRLHRIRRGDTLGRIARRHGVSVSSLAAANALSTRALLRTGRLLRIPERGVTRVASKRAKKAKKPAATVQLARNSKKSPPVKSYRVRSGDTLYRIALRHGTTVAQILAINGLPRPRTIRPGDRLKIPRSSGR